MDATSQGMRVVIQRAEPATRVGRLCPTYPRALRELGYPGRGQVIRHPDDDIEGLWTLLS